MGVWRHVRQSFEDGERKVRRRYLKRKALANQTRELRLVCECVARPLPSSGSEKLFDQLHLTGVIDRVARDAEHDVDSLGVLKG